jgi:AbiU2
MDIEELRKEIEKLRPVFLAAKDGDLDFKYIFSIKDKLPVVYSTFYLFIERIYHATVVALIIDLSKLFYDQEKSSLKRLKNKMIENYQNNELRNHLTLEELKEIFAPLESSEVRTILDKMKSIRDKYYAHNDNIRPDFDEIRIFGADTGLLVSITENILHTIELKFFGYDFDYSLTRYELGHNIFERLNEWEIYREKYGCLNDDLS